MKIKKIQVPYQPDYDEPTEVPYQSGYSIPVASKQLPSKEDVNQLEKMIREGKDKEAENFINRSVLPYEVGGAHPGLSTRDYISKALDRSIRERYPELNTMGEEITSYLPKRVYSGLNELKNKLQLSNDTEVTIGESSYKPITPFNLKQEGSMKVDASSPSFIDDILHENAHSVDDILMRAKKGKWAKGSEELNAIENFVKNNPKLKKIYESPIKETTNSEAFALPSNDFVGLLNNLGLFKRKYSPIRRLPNFQEYDPKTGEFGSDIIESPIQKYEEVGGEHHIERPFSLENFKNFSRGDLKDIVNAPAPSKFPKIKKMIG